MKTLYLCDLDGTLLNEKQQISKFSCETINSLTEKGMVFSYATARSLITAKKAAAGLKLTSPVIVNNGVFIRDNNTEEFINGEFFTDEEGEEILNTYLRNGIYPISYALIDGKERFSYVRSECSRAQWEFILTRLDRRAREISDGAALGEGRLYYFSCIDTEKRLTPIYEIFREKHRCYFSRDIYSNELWLEITPKKASKAAAAKLLKKLSGCDRLVCFGDSLNDIPMFEAADECYAVSNAVGQLKEIATGVIGANTEDGVARFLLERI